MARLASMLGYNYFMDEQASGRILLVASDLFFTSRIETAAESSGLEVVYLVQPEQIQSEALAHDAPGQFVHYLTKTKVRLVIFDLNLATVPWREWILAAKKSSQTRNIPIIAFGSHVNVEQQKAAKEAGADQVLAKSRFLQVLPQLLQKHVS